MALSPGAASAAVEFGDTCTAENAAPGPYTLLTLSTPATDLPLSAPVSGVITKVKVKSEIPFPFSVPTYVKVMRPTGGENYTVINQQTIQAVNGQAVADARMPVQAGDKLGIHGPPFTYEGTPLEGFTLYCNEVPGALGVAPGDVAVGSSATFMNATEARVPLAAVIEPDADNDGYGDETQDGCPLSAAAQTTCPLIALDTSAKVGKKAVTIVITASSEGPVTVKGVAKLGKGKKVTLKAGPKTVFPGKLASFKLKFKSKLTKRLKELEPSKKLTLKITASATNVAGQVSTDKLKVKLKGQG
ncbi:MAG TPA: hypothetical protein VNC16_08565 [Solirubrobacterales bacterium]|nr:hypothetical protein [Solirubrobacterales bacterium]